MGFTTKYPVELVGTMDMNSNSYPIRDADNFIVAWAETYEHGEELVACLNFVASLGAYDLPPRLFGPNILMNLGLGNRAAISKIVLHHEDE